MTLINGSEENTKEIVSVMEFEFLIQNLKFTDVNQHDSIFSPNIIRLF